MGKLQQSAQRKQRAETVARRCSVRKVFLKISQNSQENTSPRVFFYKEILALLFSCEFRENSKNTFSCRIPPVAASVLLLICFKSNKHIHNKKLYNKHYPIQKT